MLRTTWPDVVFEPELRAVVRDLLIELVHTCGSGAAGMAANTEVERISLLLERESNS